tara:strand:- start:1730 stop:1852 length:123 start_codon:yes stop_codon:yes gene_type:complete
MTSPLLPYLTAALPLRDPLLFPPPPVLFQNMPQNIKALYL